MKRSQVAQIAYAAYAVYAAEIGEEVREFDLAFWTHGVAAAHEAYPRTPEECHIAWMDAKIEAGWQYGTEYSEEAKTLPNLIAWQDLSVEQQVKVALFSNIVDAVRPLLTTGVSDEN